MLLPVDIHFISVISNGIDRSGQGIDIGLPKGTPIVAVADGCVVYASGDTVVLKLDEPVDIDGLPYRFALYRNVSKLAIVVDPSLDGVPVEGGRRLGRSGSDAHPSYLNFQLLTEVAGGVAGAPLARETLYSFIWKDVAAAQTGMAAVNA